MLHFSFVFQQNTFILINDSVNHMSKNKLTVAKN